VHASACVHVCVCLCVCVCACDSHGNAESKRLPGVSSLGKSGWHLPNGLSTGHILRVEKTTTWLNQILTGLMHKTRIGYTGCREGDLPCDYARVYAQARKHGWGDNSMGLEAHKGACMERDLLRNTSKAPGEAERSAESLRETQSHDAPCGAARSVGT